MALANTVANDTKFPIAQVQDAMEAWRASIEAKEQREESLLAAYNATHLGPRNQRILAYESYVAERKGFYDALRTPGARSSALRQMLAVALPEDLRATGVGNLDAHAVHTRYP